MMASALEVLSQPVVERLGWTLIHFVWQGAIVWACLAVVLWWMRNSTAHARYLVSCGVLSLMVVLPVLTFSVVCVDGVASARGAEAEQGCVAATEPVGEDRSIPRQRRALESDRGGLLGKGEARNAISDTAGRENAGERANDASHQASNGELVQSPSRTDPQYATVLSGLLPWLVAGWLAGALGMSAWHILGWSLSQRLRRRASEEVPAHVRATVERLCRQLKISCVVGIRQSAATAAPMVIGWLKPVLLAPACVLSGLPSSELEAILVHELAHIRRHDYLVNLCQTAIETLLFYHPAVWWVSRRIRIEREFCADDWATQICAGPDVYARALASLGQLARRPPRSVVAATGPMLVTRIRRVLGLSVATEPRGFRRLAHASGVAGLFVAAGLVACFAATAERPRPGGRLAVVSPDEVKRAAPNDDGEEVRSQSDLYGDPLPPGAIARIGTTRLRHPTIVRHVAFSRDGKLVASAGADGIRLWKTDSGEAVSWWPDRWTCLAFSPDGQQLACAGGSQICILDISTHEEIRRFEAKQIHGVAFAADGSFLVGWGGTYSTRDHELVSSEGVVRLFDVKTGQVLRELQGHQGYVFSACLSSDGKVLATAGYDNTIRYWETHSGLQIRQTPFVSDSSLTKDLRLPYGMKTLLAFSPNRQLLAVYMPDYSIRLCDVASGRELRRLIGHEDKVHSLAFSGDGLLLVSGGRDEKVCLWDVETGRQLRQLTGHTSWIECVAFSPDNRTVASGSQDYTVRLWDVSSGTELHPFAAPQRWILGASLSPDGRRLATGGPGGVCIWDTETGRLLCRSETSHWTKCVAFAPDGNHLVSGCSDHGIHLWQVSQSDETFALVDKGRFRKQDNAIRAVAFSPDGAMAVTGGGRNGRTVCLWDVASGTETYEWETGPHSVADVAYSPDGRRVAALCGDYTLRIWDTETGEPVRQVGEDQLTRRGILCLAFTPDSRALVTGGHGENCKLRAGRLLLPPRAITIPSAIRFWDVGTGENVRELKRDPLTLLGPDMQKGTRCAGRTVHAIAISPDGRMLASAEKDNRILLYDIDTRRLLAEFKGHRSHATELAFSSGGTRLVSISELDLTALVWDVTSVLGGQDAKKALSPHTDGSEAPLPSVAEGALAADRERREGTGDKLPPSSKVTDERRRQLQSLVERLSDLHARVKPLASAKDRALPDGNRRLAKLLEDGISDLLGQVRGLEQDERVLAAIVEQFGLELQDMPADEIAAVSGRYRGGVRVASVRPNSPAAKQGIRSGDILVGLHTFETTSCAAVERILSRPDLDDVSPIKFFVVRGSETLYGYLPLDAPVSFRMRQPHESQ